MGDYNVNYRALMQALEHYFLPRINPANAHDLDAEGRLPFVDAEYALVAGTPAASAAKEFGAWTYGITVNATDPSVGDYVTVSWGPAPNFRVPGKFARVYVGQTMRWDRGARKVWIAGPLDAALSNFLPMAAHVTWHTDRLASILTPGQTSAVQSIDGSVWSPDFKIGDQNNGAPNLPGTLDITRALNAPGFISYNFTSDAVAPAANTALLTVDTGAILSALVNSNSHVLCGNVDVYVDTGEANRIEIDGCPGGNENGVVNSPTSWGRTFAGQDFHARFDNIPLTDDTGAGSIVVKNLVAGTATIHYYARVQIQPTLLIRP